MIAAIPTAFRRGVAVEAGNPHQRHVRCHVDHRSAARGDDRRNAAAAADEGAVEVQPDHPPELVEIDVENAAVARRGAAGIVVQDVQPAEMLHGLLDRRSDAALVGYVGGDGEALSASAGDLLRDGFPGGRIDLGGGDAGAFRGHRPRRSAADAGAGTGDQRDLAFKAAHILTSPSIRHDDCA